jgi:superfamily II DNA or RNA helicase
LIFDFFFENPLLRMRTSKSLWSVVKPLQKPVCGPTLFPHQQDAVDVIEASFSCGKRKVLFAAPCSFGKTHIAASLMKKASDRGEKCVFFVDKLKLIDQTIDVFKEWGIDPGVVQGDHKLFLTRTQPSQFIRTLAKRSTL